MCSLLKVLPKVLPPGPSSAACDQGTWATVHGMCKINMTTYSAGRDVY